MKTFKAKSSVKRAIVKSLGLEAFEAGYVEKLVNGEFTFIPAPVIEDAEVIEKNMVDITINQSTIGKPCNLVWELAIEMNARAEAASEPKPARKDVINAAVAQGVAYNTARTQYQAWHKASKSESNED